MLLTFDEQILNDAEWDFWHYDEVMQMIENDFERLKSRVGKTYHIRSMDMTVIDLVFPSFDEAEYVCRLSDDAIWSEPVRSFEGF